MINTIGKPSSIHTLTLEHQIGHTKNSIFVSHKKSGTDLSQIPTIFIISNTSNALNSQLSVCTELQ